LRVKNGKRLSGLRLLSGLTAKESWKVAEVELPMDGTIGIGKIAFAVAKEGFDGGFVIGEVAEGGGVFEGELERLEGVVKADDAERASRGAGGAQNGQNIGGGAEADVPDDEFAGVGGHAFGEAELFNVEGLGFGDGADDGVEGFAMSKRMDAMNAAGEFDDFVCGGWRHVLF